MSNSGSRIYLGIIPEGGQIKKKNTTFRKQNAIFLKKILFFLKKKVFSTKFIFQIKGAATLLSPSKGTPMFRITNTTQHD